MLMRITPGTPGEGPGVPVSWRQLPPLADTVGLAGAITGNHAGTLLLAGGTNFPGLPPWEGGQRKTFTGIRALAPSAGDWIKCGELPEPRAYAACVSTPAGVIAAGGENAREVLRDCLRLQWVNGRVKISRLPDLPAPRAHAALAVLDDVLYLAGGFDHHASRISQNQFWSLSLVGAENAWRELPAWPGPPRAQAVAAAVGGQFFLTSGQEAHVDNASGRPAVSFLRDAYAFDPRKEIWRRLADLPWSAVAAPSPAPVDTGEKGFFVLGGVDGEKIGRLPREAPLPDNILRYDLAGDCWQVWPEKWPHPVVTAPAVPWAGGWAFVSGESGAGRRTPRAWHWTPASP